MPNKQKMQNYDYFDILDFKDRSDRNPTPRSRSVIFWIAIRPQDRDLKLNKITDRLMANTTIFHRIASSYKHCQCYKQQRYCLLTI